MAKFEVQHVKIDGTGHDGAPSALVVVTTSPRGGPWYVFFVTGRQGARLVTETKTGPDGQDLQIPLDYPPSGSATDVIDGGEEMRATVQQHGEDSAPALDAAQRFMNAVEQYLAKTGSS